QGRYLGRTNVGCSAGFIDVEGAGLSGNHHLRKLGATVCKLHVQYVRLAQLQEDVFVNFGCLTYVSHFNVIRSADTHVGQIEAAALVGGNAIRGTAGLMDGFNSSTRYGLSGASGNPAG